MYKFALITLSFLLILLLLATGALFFIFSPSGNTFLTPYVKNILEEKLGIPVTVDTFSLNNNTLKLNITSNESLSLKAAANYTLTDQSFEGKYRAKADDFIYGKVKIRQADIQGGFEGVSKNINLWGDGTALDANIEYSLRLVNQVPQKIIATMKEVSLSEVLAFSGQPEWAKGNVDIDINMPSISETSTQGYGHIVLHKSMFDVDLVKKTYGQVIPKKSYISAVADAKLEGSSIKSSVQAKSNLFNVEIKNGTYGLITKSLNADYSVDIPDVSILSEGKLQGPLKFSGLLSSQDEGMHVTGKSTSLEGVLAFDVNKQIKLNFNNLSLRSVLRLLRQQSTLSAKLDGEVTLESQSEKKGIYDIRLNSLHAARSPYQQNVGLQGKFDLVGKASVSGDVFGLAKVLQFEFENEALKVNTQELAVDKVLALSNLESFVKGKVDMHVHLHDTEQMNGSFDIKSSKLLTNPSIMKKRMGKPLKLGIAFESKGKVKKGVISAKAYLNTELGNVRFEETRYHTKTKELSSDYVMSIPDLQKAKVLTETDLYGNMVLQGKVSKHKTLKVNGSTSSVGGKIQYALLGDNMTINIDKVPLENILGLMGQDKAFLGVASGMLEQNTKRKLGGFDVDISDFKIKPAPWTQTATVLLGKDPSRIIFKQTKLKGTMARDVIHYTLEALGSRSSIRISEGMLDKKRDLHVAKFKLQYEEHSITGRIEGTVDDPKISVDAKSLINNRMKEKLKEKAQDKVKSMFGEEAGKLFKSLSF